MTSGLLTAALVILAGGLYLWWLYLHPYGPCPSCKDRPGANPLSTGKAWGRCRVCGGSKQRIRPAARIYRRWREEARKR